MFDFTAKYIDNDGNVDPMTLPIQWDQQNVLFESSEEEILEPPPRPLKAKTQSDQVMTQR